MDNKVGIVLDSVDASQVSYDSIHYLNYWMSQNPLNNGNIFVRRQELPCIPILCAQFPLISTIGFDGTLVFTSLLTLCQCKKAVRAKRVYFAYDLDFIRPWFNLDRSEYDSILKDVTIVARSQSYKEKLEEEGYDVKAVMSDINIESILEIVNA